MTERQIHPTTKEHLLKIRLMRRELDQLIRMGVDVRNRERRALDTKLHQEVVHLTRRAGRSITFCECGDVHFEGEKCPSCSIWLRADDDLFEGEDPFEDYFKDIPTELQPQVDETPSAPKLTLKETLPPNVISMQNYRERRNGRKS